MLRRTKSLISDQLPKKGFNSLFSSGYNYFASPDENVVYCRPAPLQLDVYKAILEHDAMKVVLLQNYPCPCGSLRQRRKCCFKVSIPGTAMEWNLYSLTQKASDGRSIASVTLSFMHLLLKTANHAALLLPKFTNNETQKKQAEEICLKAFERHPEFMKDASRATFRTLSDPKHCGKMKVLQGLLSVFHKQKSRVLVFSYSTKVETGLGIFLIADYVSSFFSSWISLNRTS